MSRKDPNRYPKGMSRKAVESIIAHYDGLEPAGWAREIAEAKPVEEVTWVRVPKRLLPEVKRVLTAGSMTQAKAGGAEARVPPRHRKSA